MTCPKENKCAHEASRYLAKKGYSELNAGKGSNERNVGGMLRCECGLVLRAKELRDWASRTGHLVSSTDDKGLFLIYEEKNSNGKGHVYVKDCGEFFGNGNYNWNGADKKTYFKLKD